MDGISIELEAAGDEEAIRRLTVRAFDGRTEEADLVEGLRDSGDLLLSLVARLDGEVVGHVAFSRVVVDDPGGPAGAVSLAPVGVQPDLQNRGVGSRLIEKGLDMLRDRGETVVLVVGHPAYYARFGFSRAAGEQYPNEYAGPHFMAMLLTGPDTAPQGPVTYPDAFELVN